MTKEEFLQFVERADLPESDRNIWIRIISDATNINEPARMFQKYLAERIDDLMEKTDINLDKNDEYKIIIEQTEHEIHQLTAEFEHKMNQIKHQVIDAHSEYQHALDEMQLSVLEE